MRQPRCHSRKLTFCSREPRVRVCCWRYGPCLRSHARVVHTVCLGEHTRLYCCKRVTLVVSVHEYQVATLDRGAYFLAGCPLGHLRFAIRTRCVACSFVPMPSMECFVQGCKRMRMELFSLCRAGGGVQMNLVQGKRIVDSTVRFRGTGERVLCLLGRLIAGCIRGRCALLSIARRQRTLCALSVLAAQYVLVRSHLILSIRIAVATACAHRRWRCCARVPQCPPSGR